MRGRSGRVNGEIDRFRRSDVPLRIGTLATTSLEDALEYSGHARLHVDATRDAIADCT